MKRILAVCLLVGVAGAALGCNSSARGVPPGQKPASPNDDLEREPDAKPVKPVKPGKMTPAIGSCGELGTQACARLDECAPFLLQTYYGERSTCEELFTGICDQASTGARPLDLGDCSAALDSCGNFVEANGVPAACFKPRGIGAILDPCRSDLDCGAGLCRRGKNERVGQCTTPAKLGEACPTPTRCETGLRCSPMDAACFKPVTTGEACASAFDCELGSKCGADMVCVPTELGDDCDQSTLPCNAGLGQTCLLDKCTSVRFADGELTCLTGNVECSGTQRCLVQQLKNLDRAALCADTAKLGESCNADTPCLEPLSCREGACSP